MRYSVYVLISQQNNSYYIGFTSKDPRVRLSEHNLGKNKYTNLHKPYRLVYYELNYCKSCALKREKFLKSGQGKKFIRLLITSQS